MTDPTPHPAHLGWRIAAAIYDLFPLLAIWMATAAASIAVTGGQLDYHVWWYRLLLIAVTAGYFVLSWRYGGQTIGMRAWRLHLVDAAGKSPGWGACLLRFVVAQVSFLAAGLGFLWCLFERERRGWHDLAAGTRFIRRPRSGD